MRQRCTAASSMLGVRQPHAGCMARVIYRDANAQTRSCRTEAPSPSLLSSSSNLLPVYVRSRGAERTGAANPRTSPGALPSSLSFSIAASSPDIPAAAAAAASAAASGLAAAYPALSRCWRGGAGREVVAGGWLAAVLAVLAPLLANEASFDEALAGRASRGGGGL